MRWAALATLAVLALGSAACGKSAAQAGVYPCNQESGLAAGSGSETLTVDGKQRTYLLTTPETSSASLIPVVFDFPGLGESAVEQEAYTHLAASAAARGWIGVTPQETGALWTIPPVPGPDDVKFFFAMLSDLQNRFCADPARVYAAGISNGAAFVGVLGCKATSLLAGIAMVEGINAYATCAEAGPLRVVGFNGTEDPIVPYSGGSIFGGANQQGGGIVPGAPKSFEQWTQRNQCSGQQNTTDVTPDVQLWSGGACSTATELYVLQGGGHTWAGAPAVAQKALGPTIEDVSATQLILDFFASS